MPPPRRGPAGKTSPVVTGPVVTGPVVTGTVTTPHADAADVLVIGCGPAGASAAIAAHDAGASVLVIEKRSYGGGNALVAGGFLWDVRGAEAVRHVETL